MSNTEKHSPKRNVAVLKIGDFDAYREEAATPVGSTPSMYQYYDSPISEFNYRFSKSIEPCDSIQDLVDTVFPEKIALIGMELGGTGSFLFTKGFRKGRFLKTTGVQFKDLRLEHQRLSDERNNHRVIEGNIFTRSKRVYNRQERRETYEERMPSWNAVRDFVNQDGKPHVLIQNILGPLTLIKNPHLLNRLISRWLTISADTSINLFWIPNSLQKDEYLILAAHFEDMKRKNPTWSITYSLDLQTDTKSVCIIKK